MDVSDERQTAKKPRLDESVDTSATQAFTNQALTAEGRTSEQRQTNEIFGDPKTGSTQGAAGSAIPEAPSASEAETGRTEGDQVSELDLGIVGPEDRLHNGDMEGADAALRAADRAKRRGSSDDAVLDALEEAEDAYDATQADASTAAAGAANQRLAGKLDTGSLPGSPASPLRQRNGSKPTVRIDETTREKVRVKILTAMQNNAALSGAAGRILEASARHCEESCCSSSTSRTVYFSKVGNVSRLAGKVTSVPELADLPRVASGQAKEIAFGNTTAAIPTRDSVTGMQGVVMK